MRHLDRDLKLLVASTVLFALGVGLYLQLFSVYALDLGASRFMIGVLNAAMLAVAAVSNIPGAWAARRFRLKPVIVVVWWLSVLASLSFFLAPSWPWLIPGLLITGLYFANNPAFKSYVYLKSDPARVARNFAAVYGSYPVGLIVAPSVGGALADRIGMRWVFLVSTGFFIASSLLITLIRDTTYHTADAPLSLRALACNRRFCRYLAFFLVGFLAVSMGQTFLSPYLAQVHDQGWTALGVYASLAALGSALLTVAMGRATDLYGPRASIGGVLVALLLGSVLLLTSASPLAWGFAVFFCGGFDALRMGATGIVGDSFTGMPLAWGYAIFDTVMGLPMAGGALLGGLLYRSGYALPFVLAIAIAAGLLVALAVTPRDAERRTLAARD
ncbi:MAG: MFS transporter [Thermoleophilia bacterium]